MTGRRSRFGSSLILIAVATVLSLSSCSRDKPDAYYSRLKAIDTLLAEGKTREAGKKLLALRRYAQGSGQWLGITKRERSAGLYRQAIDTLGRAMKKMPSNDSLAAVMVDTLLAADRPAEAARYAAPLMSTPFYVLAAEAAIRDGLARGALESVDPQAFVRAYEGTGDSVFFRDAVVLFAVRGDMSAACDLVISKRLKDPEAPLDSGDRLMGALVCYDAGLLDQAASFLEGSLIPLTPPEALLAGDTAWRMKDLGRARLCWNAAIESYPEESPLPYYNLSLVSSEKETSSSYLDACLGLFPAYYPAVVSYVRQVPESGSEDAVDEVTEALGRAGFKSMDMERRERRDIFESGRARKLLANSIAEGTDSPDVRLLIESARFENRNTPDTVRSTAEMWRLLERFPSDRTLREYAVWFFTDCHEYPTAFSINEALPEGGLLFYRGLSAAMSGRLEEALGYFSAGAVDSVDSWASLANIAMIHLRLGDGSSAIEELASAAGMAPDAGTASLLHLRIARILADMRLEDRASDVLGYALELDPENYQARALLKSLESGQ